MEKFLNKKKPSSEIFLHSWIYKNNKNIKAVVHSHSKWASILSCMRKIHSSISLYGC